MPSLNRLTQAVQPWLNLFLEAHCPLCQRSTAAVFCQDCQRQLQGCRFSQPGQNWQGELPVLAWGKYEGKLKRALAGLKYDQQPQIAQPLGEWLAQTWLSASAGFGQFRARSQPVVVPIPLHPEKLQQRGYNQAALLAQAFCDRTGLPLQAQGLTRVRSTEAQFGLSEAARNQNLADAFAIAPHWQRQKPASVLLLDDIYTTGATARSAAQTLRSRGIRVLGVVAIAQALQHGSAQV